MRFLITGGAGFIGSALANFLAQAGHEVRVIDNLSSGDRDYLSPDVFFTRGDVKDVPLLWSMLQDVDCVYHLAAKVSVAQSLLYPREYNEVNVGGTVCLMEAIRDAGIKRIVLASSGAVYGNQPAVPAAETHTPLPDSPYAVSKLAAEQYVLTLGRAWGIETVALRIFNAYGPRQNLPVSHAPVVPRFLQQAMTGGSVVLFGGGEQTRDFVYVGDVVNALVRSATEKGVAGAVLNIGSGVETSVNGLVDLIEEATGRSVNRLVNEDKESGVSRLVAEISRAQDLLNFTPEVTLLEGLRRTLREDKRFARREPS